MKLSAAVVLLVALTASPAQDTASVYETLLGAYRTTDLRAIDTLLAMPRELVGQVLTEATAGQTAWGWRELRAAALLHTDAAIRLLTASDLRGADFHAQAAERLLQRVVDLEAPQDDFAWRWYLTVTAVARRLDAPGMTHRLEHAMAKRWPARSPRDLYLKAVSLEMQIARTRVGSGPSATRGDVYTRWFVGAAAALEQALERQPAFGAASLHLGRIRMLEGRRQQAATLFQTATTGVDPTVRYLASLFLGSLHERDGRLAEAEALYRAAASHWPYGQSAAFALAELLSRVGREEDARRTLADRLLAPTALRGLEPLWIYSADPRGELGMRLGLLRAETWHTSQGVFDDNLAASNSRFPLQRWLGSVRSGHAMGNVMSRATHAGGIGPVTRGSAAVRPVIARATTLAQDARFTTRVEAVRVDALVTNGNRPLAGLTAEDFELRDAGVVQAIESVALADLPISLMVALDTSESVAGETLQKLQEGVSLALHALGARDRAALITFSAEVRATPWSDAAGDLTNTLREVRAGGGTALWDAAFAALTLRDDTPTVRRLVMVFSDGQDTASWLPRNSVLDRAKRTDAVTYTVSGRSREQPSDRALHGRSGIELSPGDARSWIETPFLEELAELTGGAAIEVSAANDLRDAFGRILNEFRTRYLITYTPRGVDAAGWHPIDVRLKTTRGTVQARRGYFK